MSKFQVGDEVQVISQPPPRNEWKRGPLWIEEMSRLCGETAVIAWVNGRYDGSYRIRGTNPQLQGFTWLADWLAPAEPDVADAWIDDLELV